MLEYIYIQQNNDWDYEKKYKFGYTSNPLQRIKNSHEQHSHKSKYIALYLYSVCPDFMCFMRFMRFMHFYIFV